MRVLAPCGTAAAYRRHLSRGEPACASCLAANAAAVRDYYAQNPEKRFWRAHPAEALEKTKEWQRRNREKHLGLARKYARQGRHGRDIDAVVTLMWDEQQGRCYLCAGELDAVSAVIDHDHRCCPRNQSCKYCRRGLACGPCNSLVGFAGDDPERLRRIADNLQAALKAADVRMAQKPRQQALDI